MGQVKMQGRSTLGVSSLEAAQEKAARATMLVLDGAKIPAMHATKWRRRRDRHAEPSPLARVIASVRELAAFGVARERAEMLVAALRDAVAEAYGDAPARLTAEHFARELRAESAENLASLRYLQGDRSPAACREWADALDHENALQAEMIRALRAEAEGAR